MPRYARKTTQQELEAHVRDNFDHYILQRDVMSKVEVSDENTDLGTDDEGWSKYTTGYMDLGDELKVWGIAIGGDWETPVFVALYLDDKGLRAYCPKKGNIWNYSNKSALGNDFDQDEEFLAKFGTNVEDFDTAYWEGVNIPLMDMEAIQNDIRARIQVR